MSAGRGTTVQTTALYALITFTLCTAFGAFMAAQLTLFYAGVQGQALAWSRAAWFTLPSAYVWGLLTPVVAWVVGRWPPELRVRAVWNHALAGLGLSLTHVVLTASVLWWLERGSATAGPWLQVLRFQFLSAIHTDLLTYLGVAGCLAAWRWQRESRRRAVEAAGLAAELSEAKLGTLRAQLRPHFLFNTLNAIAALVRENPVAAERMILDLSDLLRAAIDERRERVSLREELAFARRYVEIEQARFGERLRVRWESGEDALDATVPYLVLQPLLENAVRHGLSARPGPCAIEVSARRENGRLLLTVRDDGPGLSSGSVVREGLGLRATRARLAELFGDRFRFALDNAPGGGCRVRIDVPVEAALPDDVPAEPAS